MNGFSLLITIGLGILLLYGGILFFRQNSLIFRPGGEISRTPSDLGIPFEELELTCEDGTRILAWWVPHMEAIKAVIYFHGSDGNISSYVSVLAYLYPFRLNMLVVDYPGYGKSAGRPSERGCYQAAEAAWNFVRINKGFRAENIIVFGQSLGCAVGTYLTSKMKCGGLVLQSGFTSVPDMAAHLYPFLPVRLFCLTKMNSLKRIDQCSCPLLLLHSTSDEHIPIAHSERVYKRAKQPKKFVRYSGSHVSNAWQYSPEVRQAWEEILSGKTERWGLPI
jgi:uncharacterized protein